MTKLILSILLVAIAILQLHNVFSYPTTRGFDAQGHIAYIEFLKAQKRVPYPFEGWEMWQPPLYYVTSSFFPSILSVRLLGFFSWLILSFISYIFFKQYFKSIRKTLLGILVVVSLPVIIYLTPAIGNEFFSGTLISLSLIFYLLNIKKQDLRTKIVLGILLGSAMLSKSTTFVLIISIIIDQLWQNRWNIVKVLKNLLVPLGSAVIVSGWFYGRNIILFRNPFIASVDFPPFKFSQPPGFRDLNFLIDITGFLKFDLFKAHHYSLLSGTYFSWFYDGHNAIVPVQEFSKIGALLVIFSLPIFIFLLIGYVKELRKISEKNRILILYPLLLFISYILYNFKLPFYSTVKGAFLVSAVIPFVYFVLKGLVFIQKKYFMNSKNFTNFLTLYLFVYAMIIMRNFWILPWWYKQ